MPELLKFHLGCLVIFFGIFQLLFECVDGIIGFCIFLNIVFPLVSTSQRICEITGQFRLMAFYIDIDDIGVAFLFSGNTGFQPFNDIEIFFILFNFFTGEVRINQSQILGCFFDHIITFENSGAGGKITAITPGDAFHVQTGE